jgi:hypothetical protein
MATFSSLRETRTRLEKLIAEMTEPRWRLGLEDFLQHWWAEVIGDLDAAMSMFTSDVEFRSYGSLGASSEATVEERRAVYQAILDAGMLAAGSWDNERFLFGESAIMMEATWTFVHFGAMVNDHSEPLDPAAPYLVQRPLCLIMPITEVGHIKGEVLYVGQPSLVEPVDPTHMNEVLGPVE